MDICLLVFQTDFRDFVLLKRPYSYKTETAFRRLAQWLNAQDRPWYGLGTARVLISYVPKEVA